MTEPQQNSQDPDKYVKELSKILLVLKKAKKEEVDKQRERIIELVKEIEKSNLHKRVLEFWKEVEYSENPELKSALGWESQKSAETKQEDNSSKNGGSSSSSNENASSGNETKFIFPYIS